MTRRGILRALSHGDFHNAYSTDEERTEDLQLPHARGGGARRRRPGERGDYRRTEDHRWVSSAQTRTRFR